MLDEKSRQDVDTNLQDVAQIPERRLRLWPFVCRGPVRATVDENGAGKNPGISILPLRFCSGGDRVCYFVPSKTFIRDKTPPQIHLVRTKTFIRNQFMWMTSVWP